MRRSSISCLKKRDPSRSGSDVSGAETVDTGIGDAPIPAGRPATGYAIAWLIATTILLAGCGDAPSAPPAATGSEGSTENADTPGTSETVLSDTPLAPEFTITAEDLTAFASDLPEEIAGPIVDNGAAFLADIAPLLDVDPIVLRLVDKDHPLPEDYAPTDLVNLVDLNRNADRLTLNQDGLSLREMIIPDLLAMVDAAAEDGVVLDISSSYRSYAYQEWLFQYWVDELGLEEAERVSARPGTSQHQLGTTVDFGSVTPAYADAPGGIWLANHAWRYGFSLSYPEGYEDLTGYAYEPWHFRWIGREATRVERVWFGGVQQYMLEFLHNNADILRTTRTDLGKESR
ncbi:MAG: M15 family metallopeptidase [Alkalispirochaeta sp.]